MMPAFSYKTPPQKTFRIQKFINFLIPEYQAPNLQKIKSLSCRENPASIPGNIRSALQALLGCYPFIREN